MTWRQNIPTENMDEGVFQNTAYGAPQTKMIRRGRLTVLAFNAGPRVGDELERVPTCSSRMCSRRMSGYGTEWSKGPEKVLAIMIGYPSAANLRSKLSPASLKYRNRLVTQENPTGS